jgi:O-antigen/teichoic acid export membrane protein
LISENQEYTIFGRHVGYVILVNLAALLLGLVQLPILTKGLGTSLYGIWSLIFVTISLIVPFALLAFNTSTVRFLAAKKDIRTVRDDFYSACTIVFISGAIFSIVLFFLSDFLAVSIFKDADAASYIKLAAALILLNSLHTMTLAFFRMRRQIGLYSILTLLSAVFRVGLIAAAILFDYELGGVIVVVIINGALFTLVPLLIIFRQVGIQLPRFSNMKSYLKWGIPLIPNAAMLWIIAISDRYMVSYFLGVSSAGVYSASYAIGQYATFVLTPLTTVLYPTISKAYDEGNRDESAKYLKYSLKYLMMISIPAAFGLSMLAKPLLRILTTPEFVTGSTVVPWVASGAVIFCFYQMGVHIIHLVGKTYITVRLLSIAAALNIGLNLLLIPRMGIVGAAVATLVAYGVLGLITLLVTRRYLKFGLSPLFMAKSVLASAVMTLCLWLINPHSWVWVIISIVAGALIYFAVLLAIKGLSRQELSFFINFFKDNLKRIGIIKG